jgi:putative redox protein
MSSVKLTWTGDTMFVASDNRGHAFVLDTNHEAGGSDSAVQPLDLLLFALGGCMGYDIVSILKKKRADLRALKMEVSGERAPEHPKRFVKMHLKLRTNSEVKQEDVQRAFELSRDKYCSVLGTLKNPGEFEFDVGTE